ncbi:hypothetical protein ILYODFUR_010224, partial [Ilyodon furcidens]
TFPQFSSCSPVTTCYHFHLIACLPLSLVHTPPPSVYKLVVAQFLTGSSCLIPGKSLDVFWSVVAGNVESSIPILDSSSDSSVTVFPGFPLTP